MSLLIVSKKFPSRLSEVCGNLSLILAKVDSFGFVSEDIFAIKLSLEEALTNAVRHGNRQDPSLSVEVSVYQESREMVFFVRDEGAGFQEAGVPDPLIEENREKPSGRGLHLMRTLMDSVQFLEGGRLVRMTKRLPEDQ